MNISELRNREFETARGKTVKFSEMEHSHLCNIIYYQLYINGDNGCVISFLARNEIEERFNGEMLQYEPKYAFEVDRLMSKGMLEPNSSGGYDIIDNGVKVGVVKKMAILSNL